MTAFPFWRSFYTPFLPTRFHSLRQHSLFGDLSIRNESISIWTPIFLYEMTSIFLYAISSLFLSILYDWISSWTEIFLYYMTGFLVGLGSFYTQFLHSFFWHRQQHLSIRNDHKALFHSEDYDLSIKKLVRQSFILYAMT